jgi:hypothetical protein
VVEIATLPGIPPSFATFCANSNKDYCKWSSEPVQQRYNYLKRAKANNDANFWKLFNSFQCLSLPSFPDPTVNSSEETPKMASAKKTPTKVPKAPKAAATFTPSRSRTPAPEPYRDPQQDAEEEEEAEEEMEAQEEEAEEEEESAMEGSISTVKRALYTSPAGTPSLGM